MANQLVQIICKMDGFPGAPGYMTFYGDTPHTLREGVIAFVLAVKSAMPLDVNITVPSTGNIIQDTDGAVTGTWSDGADTTQFGSATGGYAGPAGACVNWATGVIVGRRRLRGRTFLVPLAGGAYQSDGSIEPTTLANLRSAASGLAGIANMRIWHRPTKLNPTGGSSFLVTAGTVADRAAVLRSRRA